VENLSISIVSVSGSIHGPVQDLLLAFEDHLENFLANTTLPWFIRTTEDCFVHLKRLPVMIKSLESEFNPRTDYVFKGHSVDLGGESLFVHGGSGWIMSRAACQYYHDQRAEIDRRFFAEPFGDDLMPKILCELRHTQWLEMDHDAWIGSPMDDDSSTRIQKGNYDGLTGCPDLESQKRRSRPGRFIRDLVFWHSGRNDIVTVIAGYKATVEAGDDIMLAHVYGGVRLCRFNPIEGDKWNSWWESH
jgi:hypothetical protein